jgi:hypothetical protein
MAIYKVHVFINPFEGRDAEFNAWYDAEHIPDVLALPGFLRAERFEVHPLGNEPMRYLTVYEAEADTPEEVLERIRAGQPGFRHSDSVDFSTAFVVATSPLGSRVGR